MEPHQTANPKRQTAWLTLALTPGLGNRSILRLVKRFGSPEAALNASEKELEAVAGLRGKALAALARKETTIPPQKEWEAIQRQGFRLLCLDDPEYPANLAAIPDPPAILYISGAPEPRDLVSVSVVGSRAASPAGIVFTEGLCRDLAARGVVIVSGMAVGIDAAAHRGAVKAGGRTLGVLGCGLDVDYPRANGELKKRIAENGVLYSEFPLGTPPAPGHFPMRNRIISGLGLGVVVVEAANKSGSLITARLALEQGREVFAVPGQARSFRSVGTHQLLREGAKLVETAEDILEEIRSLVRPSWAPESKAPAPPETALTVTGEEAELLGALDDSPQHIDEICRSLEWPISRVSTILLALELKGKARQLPGKYFSLLR
ncbi:MAG: DNA-processing protein DprA [Syntrophobacteraceae bacterium]